MWSVKEMDLSLTQTTAKFDVDSHVELTTHSRFYEGLGLKTIFFLTFLELSGFHRQ